MSRLTGIALTLLLGLMTTISPTDADADFPQYPGTPSDFFPFSKEALQSPLIPYLASQQTSNEAGLNRTPLILIHGVGPNKGYYFNWHLFLQSATEAGLLKTHDIYFFHYDPQQPVSASAARLSQALESFWAKNPTYFHVIALSQGGLVFREAYETPFVRRWTQKALMLGTPFHGTPLADPPWIKAVAKDANWFDPIRLGLPLVYEISRQALPHFQSDFCWDNIDRQKPDLGQADGYCNKKVDQPAFEQDPFITYAGFYNAPLNETEALIQALQSNGIDSDNKTPEDQATDPQAFSTQLQQQLQTQCQGKEANPFSRKLYLDVAKNQMTKIKPIPHKNKEVLNKGNANEENSASKILSLHQFNDGVVPIHSALWWGRWQTKPTQSIAKNPSSTLKKTEAWPQSRLFCAIDHQNWMEGKPRNNVAVLNDWLHPTLPAKDLFSWMMDDLRQTAPQAFSNALELSSTLPNAASLNATDSNSVLQKPTSVQQKSASETWIVQWLLNGLPIQQTRQAPAQNNPPLNLLMTHPSE